VGEDEIDLRLPGLLLMVGVSPVDSRFFGLLLVVGVDEDEVDVPEGDPFDCLALVEVDVLVEVERAPSSSDLAVGVTSV
jgi:hypothetical protein